MIVNSYFSGGGLFDIGFEQAGIAINESFEIDVDCCKVQRANFNVLFWFLRIDFEQKKSQKK